ncbi:DUF3221 domain-containing protein [Ornithinibacillus salinisoli]|uniref:DUF3221 domain-containing protein n=1 Tax=Ornithinibacillus salinisoli TaxID=1848459 RepID=A0ABW4VSN9_9BACI
MNLLNHIRVSIFLLIFIIPISGCSAVSEQFEPSLKGFILEVEGREVLVAENISTNEYDEIKDIPIDDLDNEKLSLIYITYEDVKGFDKGNEIKVWLDGDIATSYPAQAKAKKIELIE